MDCSQCPLHPTLAPVFVAYAKRHIEMVRSHDAVPVPFMSWAYAGKLEMTRQLAEAYTKVGNDNRAMVIPAGLAFARVLKAGRASRCISPTTAIRRWPAPNLAATSYAALYRKSLEDNTYTAGLDPELAKYLRTVTPATVQDYYSGGLTN